MRLACIAAAIVALSACATPVPPPPGDPVPFKVITTSGLPSNGMDVIADSSVQGVLGLLLGSSARNQTLCTYASYASACWPSAGFPTGSAAFGVEVSRGCSASDLVGAYLAGSSLAFEVRVGQNQCAPGAGAVPEPTFQLVAISLSDLPTELIGVHVYYAGVESSRSALLDLRSPVPDPPSLATREVEVQNAINQASSGASRGFVTELAARRFAGGAIACVPPAATDVQPGYVLAFDGVDGEFDYAGGQVAHCPATTP